MLVGRRDPVMRAGRRAVGSLLVGALVGAGAALAWYVERPTQYTSTIALEITPATAAIDLNPTGPRLDPVTVDTDALIMVSDDVAVAVAAATGGDPHDVARELSVRARPQSRVLELSYTTDRSADAAREGVTAAAEEYLDQRTRLIIDPVRTYVRQVISAATAVQDAYPSTDDTVSGGQVTLENRLERAQAYQIQLPPPGLVVVSASEPTGRRGTFNVIVVSGALLGALLGFGVGLAWEAAHTSRRASRGGSS